MVIASFLLAFKAVLVEGSEVAILSVATIKQLGKNNVFLGVVAGGAASIIVFLGVGRSSWSSQKRCISIATGLVILYFSSRFLRGFGRYYFGKGSLGAKMDKLEAEVVDKDMGRYGEERPQVVPFSFINSLPVFTITLTEGFEASLVLAAAGTFNLQWTLIGAGISIVFLIAVSAVSYEYLLRFPRWALDLLAGSVLLIFGSYFLVTGILLALSGGSMT